LSCRSVFQDCKRSVAVFKQELESHSVLAILNPFLGYGGNCNRSWRAVHPYFRLSFGYTKLLPCRVYFHRGLTFFIERVEKERERPKLTFSIISPPGRITIKGIQPIEVQLLGVAIENKSRTTVKDCQVALVTIEKPWIKRPAFWIGSSSTEIDPGQPVEIQASRIVEALRDRGNLVPAIDLDPTDSALVVVAFGIDALPNKVFLASEQPQACPPPLATRESLVPFKIRVYGENFQGLESSTYAIKLGLWDQFSIRRVRILTRRKSSIVGLSS